MIEFQGRKYFDHRLFVFELRNADLATESGKKGPWVLLKRSNVVGYPIEAVTAFRKHATGARALADAEVDTPCIGEEHTAGISHRRYLRELVRRGCRPSHDAGLMFGQCVDSTPFNLIDGSELFGYRTLSDNERPLVSNRFRRDCRLADGFRTISLDMRVIPRPPGQEAAPFERFHLRTSVLGTEGMDRRRFDLASISLQRDDLPVLAKLFDGAAKFERTGQPSAITTGRIADPYDIFDAEDLIAFSQAYGRVYPENWWGHDFYPVAPEGEPTERWPVPLILGGADAPDEQKAVRFAQQIRWIARYGDLASAARHILELPEDHWVHGPRPTRLFDYPVEGDQE